MYVSFSQTCGPVHACNDFTACVACVFEVRENSLTRTRNNCSVQCETIDNIIQVNNMGQIPSTQRRVLECNRPLSGDRCRVDYYFTVTRTTRDIYVVSTLQGMCICMYVCTVYALEHYFRHLCKLALKGGG